MNDELVKGRNSYSYPPVGLCALKTLENPSDWEQAYQIHKFKTTLELDLHHYYHLHSNDDQEVLLGIYSVMYWGYITSGAKSKTRCDWLSKGNSRNPEASINHIGISAAVQIIRDSIALLEKGSYGCALTEVRKLPHVGVSFGTKYLAFLDLENVGVLDDKITRHLAAGSYEHLLSQDTLRQLVKSKNESPSSAAARFQAFCEALSSIKSKVNASKKGWKDASGSEMCRFRTVDIERALFAIAKTKDA